MLNLEADLLSVSTSNNPKLDNGTGHRSVIVLDPVDFFLLENLLLFSFIFELFGHVTILANLDRLFIVGGQIWFEITHYLSELIENLVSMHKQGPGSENLVDLVLHPGLIVLHEQLPKGLSNYTIGFKILLVIVFLDLDPIGIKPLIRVEFNIIGSALPL